ncbi:putative fluoride ion transporter CrcB [Pseudovibrio axinellae]|uniref:Fluoride-specific ion channel FluC n=1 Tax=Pseudovibrio axinellae TaxID=989403 RepID=A0A161XGZ2_9HYPH|nr:fluoride efflux transporter CrcB [Pseudovibrio axinellae]KZL21163.1 putative fluoride ion transporter CrcB [Pseudovibrio axinellae]SEQ89917.1 camphor resistance protein CrcB [Pseudovibrio axinellae]
MKELILIALGGGTGAVCRHLVSMAGLRLLGSSFPWGTITVNILGSLLMGVFVEVLAQRMNASSELRYLIATGFLGGFTTFSTFSLDVAVLWERGEPFTAALYVMGSLFFSVSALFAGLYLTRQVLA